MGAVRKIKPETEAAIVADYAAGMRSGELSAKYGINRKTVTIVVKRCGAQVRDQRSASGRPVVDPNSYVPAVLELRAKGFSQQRIGQEVGICQSTISRVLIQNGLHTRLPVLKGGNHGSWKGGRVTTGEGYIGVRVTHDDMMASMAVRSGYVLEHRLVMARHLGRPLHDGESVHHINGDRTDNRLENLQLRQGKHGKGTVMCCADCGSRRIVHRELDDRRETKAPDDLHLQGMRRRS